MSEEARLALVVEDMPDARALYVRRLRRAGFVVLEASNGQQAVAMALAECPSVILMDLEMPVMDGWEACRWLKTHALTSAIPIVVVSAHDRDDRGGCAADAFLPKPTALAEIVEAVEKAASRPRAA